MKARPERGPARELPARRGIARWVCYVATFAATILASSSAWATTITLSDASSDATPASVLDATFEFNVLGFDTLELVVTNDTTAPDEFNINELRRRCKLLELNAGGSCDVLRTRLRVHFRGMAGAVVAA